MSGISRIENLTGYKLPLEFYKESATAKPLTSGDREALSSLIATYSFSSNTYDLMRFITAFNSTLQSYIVRLGRGLDYYSTFNEINLEIANARTLLDSPRGSGQAAIILYSVEIALKIIAEREGLTLTAASMYEGKMPLSPEAFDYSDNDPYTL